MPLSGLVLKPLYILETVFFLLLDEVEAPMPSVLLSTAPSATLVSKRKGCNSMRVIKEDV